MADVDLGTSGDTYKINLSPINISKCLFIWKYQERLGSIDRSSYTMELKEDCILFTNTSSGSYYVDLIDFDWQIIEFY